MFITKKQRKEFLIRYDTKDVLKSKTITTWEQQAREDITQKEEYGTKLNKRSFDKAELDGEVWLPEDPHKAEL
jgi:hypothetical protein